MIHTVCCSGVAAKESHDALWPPVCHTRRAPVPHPHCTHLPHIFLAAALLLDACEAPENGAVCPVEKDATT